MWALLQGLAGRAAAATNAERLVLIDVGENGIAIAGKAFLPGVGAAAPGATFSTMDLTSWQAITAGGVFPLHQSMDRVIDALDRVLAAAEQERN